MKREEENLVNATPRWLGDRQIGALGFGCWRLVGNDTQAATRLISSALELGMTLIDNADVYGLDWGGTAFGESERLLGSVLAQNPTLRDKMVLASKGSILPRRALCRQCRLFERRLRCLIAPPAKRAH